MLQFHIGTLVGSAIADGRVQDPIGIRPDEPFLNPRLWRPAVLDNTVRVNHNCYVYRFKLNSPTNALGLRCGQHVYLRIRKNGELVQRAYTPISALNTAGVVEFLVK